MASRYRGGDACSPVAVGAGNLAQLRASSCQERPPFLPISPCSHCGFETERVARKPDDCRGQELKGAPGFLGFILTPTILPQLRLRRGRTQLSPAFPGARMPQREPNYRSYVGTTTATPFGARPQRDGSAALQAPPRESK